MKNSLLVYGTLTILVLMDLLPRASRDKYSVEALAREPLPRQRFGLRWR